MALKITTHQGFFFLSGNYFVKIYGKIAKLAILSSVSGARKNDAILPGTRGVDPGGGGGEGGAVVPHP